MSKACYTREQIESAVKSKGYKWFENGDYNVNIVGIRNSETKNKVTNKFDDCITVSYKKMVNGNFTVLSVLQTQAHIGWRI